MNSFVQFDLSYLISLRRGPFINSDKRIVVMDQVFVNK